MREYDVRVKLTMSSVWYVHTQHFMQETFAFIQHFNKLQDILGRSRAVASGKKVNMCSVSFILCTSELNLCGRFFVLLNSHGQVTIIFVVSVGLFVCAEFFSAVFDPILIKLGHMLYVWV